MRYALLFCVVVFVICGKVECASQYTLAVVDWIAQLGTNPTPMITAVAGTHSSMYQIKAMKNEKQQINDIIIVCLIARDAINSGVEFPDILPDTELIFDIVIDNGSAPVSILHYTK